jgi:DNA replication protein DnaC
MEISKMIPPDLSVSYPQYDYILTPEEEKEAIDWVIGNEKKRHARKLAEMGLNEESIIFRLSQIDVASQIDRTRVLEAANLRKNWKLEEISNREKEAKERALKCEQMALEFNANKFYSIIKKHFIEKNGFFKDDNMPFFKVVCYFFSNDSRFESELNYSFNKGLFLYGTAGLGKTEVIKAISKNPRFPVKIISILEITEIVKERGSCELNTNQILMIDDVGTEPDTVNHYGTKVNWFKDFIELYYLKNNIYSGLIITSNLGGDELEKKYGYRVRSRIREMFNLIKVEGTDLRG